MISRSGLNMGHVWSKTRSLGQISLELVHPLETTIFLQSSWKFIRVFVLMISWSALSMGPAGSKPRSLGHFFLKPCSPSRGHTFASIFLKIYQNACLSQVQIWVMSDQKLGQIALQPCLPSRDHSFASIFMKLCQNICLDDTLVKFEYESCWIEN